MDAFTSTRKPARAFNIDGETSVITSMPTFTRNEEENATILGAAFGDGDKSDPSNYNYNYNRMGAAKVQKTQQEEALENVQKSFSELAQLLALTALLQTQEHVVISNVTRPPGLDAIGQILPPSQLISIRQRDFAQVAGIIEGGVQTAGKIVEKRQLMCKHLLTLRKHWRLAAYTHASASGSSSHAAAPVLTGRDTIAVDCSYGTKVSLAAQPAPIAGGAGRNAPPQSSLATALSRSKPCLLPLLFGADGAPVLSADEPTRPLDSLCLSLLYAPTGKTLASACLWDLARQSLREGPRGSALEAVHLACLDRQHESLCRLLLGCIKSDAATLSNSADGSCRWIVAPLIAKDSDPRAPLDAEDAASIFALERAGMSPTTDIAAISRSQVVLLVTQNIQLVIQLLPQTQHAAGEAGKTSGYTSAAKSLARAMLRAQAHLAEQIGQFDGSTAAPLVTAAESYLGLLLEGAREAIR